MTHKKESGFLRKFGIILFLSLPFLLAIIYEIRTNELQATFFFRYSRDITWEVKPGKNKIFSPQSGPYDLTLGYARLPYFQRLLENSGYIITHQAHQSPKTQFLIKHGIAIPYEKKPNPGLRIYDKNGAQIYYVNLNPGQFSSFESIPPLLVNALLYRENRELFDFKHPFLNPAIEWDRFALALANYLQEKIFYSSRGIGGSTLATQIIKFRHSPKGLTGSPIEKLRQIISASLWAYHKSPNTLEIRKEIVKEYLNSMPLGAAAGHGEINGIGNGMWAWYGKKIDQVINDLNLPETNPKDIYKKAATFKEIFSLIIATRYPNFYLKKTPQALNEKSNEYLPLLEKAGIISPNLAQAALSLPLKFRPHAPFPPPVSFRERKGVDSLRIRLLELLNIKTLYELDRLDLTAHTTLDFETQQKVNSILNSLYDPEFLKQQGFFSPYLLNQGDPKKVVYSITLFESLPEGNFLRVQTDTLNRPLNIATGVKLELGSTAKLRTLATYLMAIDAVDNDLLKQKTTGEIKPLEDNLSKWVTEYRLLHPEATKEELLKASLQREFSANPNVAFFTGGGLHVFKNFKKDQDDKHYTLEEGLCQSVNLVFIRLMKELVEHYIAKLGYDKKNLLSDPNHPQRKELLKEAAEEEAITFLRKFYRIHYPKTYTQSREILCQSYSHPIRNWALLYLKENPQVSYNEFVANAKIRFGESSLDFTYLQKLFKSYRGKTFNLIDEAYLLGKHPLEVWIVNYLKTHPRASWAEVLNDSQNARTLASSWLFKTKFFSAQNLRIETLLEKKAFAEIHRNWKSLGYPFESLVPSLATTIGSSSDRPISLAELIGIIINDGIYKPTLSLPHLHFAAGTPYETRFSQIIAPGKRVMSPEVARVLKEALTQVVERGTAQRIKHNFIRLDNTPMEVGGKTGTGDNRFETFRQSGAVASSKIINRTSTFVFFVDNYFGIVTAHVEGPEAGEYEFTSALAVQVLKTLKPALEPLFQSKVSPSNLN